MNIIWPILISTLLSLISNAIGFKVIYPSDEQIRFLKTKLFDCGTRAQVGKDEPDKIREDTRPKTKQVVYPTAPDHANEQITDIGSWPWIVRVSISERRPKNENVQFQNDRRGKHNSEDQFCIGAMLTDSHIITSPECANIALDGSEQIAVSTVTGIQRLPQVSFVSAIVPQDKSSSPIGESSFVILRTELPISLQYYVKPLCINVHQRLGLEGKRIKVENAPDVLESRCFVPKFDPSLKYEGMFSFDKLRQVDVVAKRDGNNHLIVKGVKTSRLCLPDRGTPLMCFDKDDTYWVLAGVKTPKLQQKPITKLRQMKIPDSLRENYDDRNYFTRNYRRTEYRNIPISPESHDDYDTEFNCKPSHTFVDLTKSHQLLEEMAGLGDRLHEQRFSGQNEI